jgi:hypothetical protein
VAQTVINQEAARVKDIASGSSIADALYDFYQGAFDFIYSGFVGVFNSYQSEIAEATIFELGGADFLKPFDVGDQIDSFIGTFKRQYAEGYTTRHIKSSFGQLNALVDVGADAIVERVDEWQERRPRKISRNEATRGNQSMFSSIAFYYGFKVRWVTVGANCPFCNSLSGKVITKG